MNCGERRCKFKFWVRTLTEVDRFSAIYQSTLTPILNTYRLVYYQLFNCFIFVFNLNDQDSFDRIKRCFLRVKQENLNSKSIFRLHGNQAGEGPKVPDELINSFVKENGFSGFHKYSFKTGTISETTHSEVQKENERVLPPDANPSHPQ